ncbi:hypothetical protein RHSIM_Rhsim03G0140600 [Rhododendron simsii]|uniref:Uncharacterized protein n=1 Tax=Rhododendron simsii TaxID=118357 RepID=A0A834LTJ6_RHOSS|nr:hypothetical protein RHSIM_Rhsim03G0140600 [Rhododendron simsii]
MIYIPGHFYTPFLSEAICCRLILWSAHQISAADENASTGIFQDLVVKAWRWLWFSLVVKTICIELRQVLLVELKF